KLDNFLVLLDHQVVFFNGFVVFFQELPVLLVDEVEHFGGVKGRKGRLADQVIRTGGTSFPWLQGLVLAMELFKGITLLQDCREQ
ncbi:MAG: hypothetical protein JRJ78_14810, partial [Deltaproteobacteria bacterium]|nr:hypothetical protein [Deltaproteobacteria bacterium]